MTFDQLGYAEEHSIIILIRAGSYHFTVGVGFRCFSVVLKLNFVSYYNQLVLLLNLHLTTVHR